MHLLAIVAWYGLLYLGGEWQLVGPYDERAECVGVMEWLDTQGYETESCTMISTDNESIPIQIGEYAANHG